MSRSLGAAALLAGALLSSAPLRAQPGERENPHLRNDCRLAAQVLRTGHPAPRREWAMDALRRCDVSGPEVLAGIWRRTAPSDTTELDRLFNTTRDFNHRLVIDAIAEVARRTDAAETTRIYALALLFNYAVPGRYLDTGALLQGRRPGISFFTHDERAHHTRALLGDLRPELRVILTSVAAAEPDSRVGTAAALVLRQLNYY